MMVPQTRKATSCLSSYSDYGTEYRPQCIHMHTHGEWKEGDEVKEQNNERA